MGDEPKRGASYWPIGGLRSNTGSAADSTDRQTSSAGRTIRAVDEYAAQRWSTAAAVLPDKVASFYARAVAEKADGVALQGKLGHVEIGLIRLAHREARMTVGVPQPEIRERHSRAATIKRVQVQDRLGVLYTVDDANATVWVTEVHVLPERP